MWCCMYICTATHTTNSQLLHAVNVYVYITLYRKFDELSAKFIDQLRRLTKQIQVQFSLPSFSMCVVHTLDYSVNIYIGNVYANTPTLLPSLP